MEGFNYTPGIPMEEKEGLDMVRAFYRSKKGPKTWYKSLRMSPKTFYKWKRHYDTHHKEHQQVEEPEAEPSQLYPIRLVDSPRETSIGKIEIQYPNGTVLVLPSDSGIDLGKLESLIRLQI